MKHLLSTGNSIVKARSFSLPIRMNHSEEKAKLLRKIGGLVEEKDQEVALFLSSLQV